MSDLLMVVDTLRPVVPECTVLVVGHEAEDQLVAGMKAGAFEGLSCFVSDAMVPSEIRLMHRDDVPWEAVRRPRMEDS